MKNIYISDLGIKLYVKKLTFGELRDENLDYHLQVESKMLNDFGRILIEMLSNEVIPDTGLGDTPAADQHMFGGSIDEILNNLEIDPELKAIIYECIHAKEKVAQKEEEGY